MWQTTTRQLLVVTFWLGVALAAILIKTNEPFGIVIASMALAFAAIGLLDRRSRLLRSERASVILMIVLLVGFMLIIGVAFTLLGH